MYSFIYQASPPSSITPFTFLCINPLPLPKSHLLDLKTNAYYFKAHHLFDEKPPEHLDVPKHCWSSSSPILIIGLPTVKAGILSQLASD